MDMDIYLDLPGGDDFCNVAQVFLDAAKGIYFIPHRILTRS